MSNASTHLSVLPIIVVVDSDPVFQVVLPLPRIHLVEGTACLVPDKVRTLAMSASSKPFTWPYHLNNRCYSPISTNGRLTFVFASIRPYLYTEPVALIVLPIANVRTRSIPYFLIPLAFSHHNSLLEVELALADPEHGLPGPALRSQWAWCLRDTVLVVNSAINEVDAVKTGSVDLHETQPPLGRANDMA